MATPLTVEKLLAALEHEGVRVEEHLKWKTHGRDSATGKPFGPVSGVMIHHTAGTDSSAGLSLVRDGRSDLPGPLAHTYIGKDGTVHLLSNGRANHAGMIARNAFDAVVAESMTHPRPDASEPIDGNDRFYGAELANLGNGNDPYPDAQYDAAVRWAAAICRAHGWSANSVIGHKEGTRRKIDPSFDMDTFRACVAERLAHSADWDGTEEDELTITAEDIARAVWAHKLNSPTAAEGTDPLREAGTFLRYTDAKQQALLARIGALEAAVVALATSGGLTAEQVTAAAQAGATAALKQLGSVLTTS